MLHERRSLILTRVRQDRMVKVTDLMQEHGVSIETIRRDLEDLEKQGVLRRVYGGAVVNSLYGQEPDYASREIIHYEEKRAIAAKAAELIEDGDTLFIDVGTTTLEAARFLSGKKNLTVITNATATACAMAAFDNCRVILLGGELKPGELSTSGFLCEESLKYFHAGKALLGTGGISSEWGLTDYHLYETNARRIMIQRSELVIVLADYSKLGASAMNCVCPLEQVDILVTDWSAPARMVNKFREAGVTLMIAPRL